MAGLKAWDGSAFVDGEPRIWNGTGFVAPSACHVWDGSGFVKVWPSFARQRMVKTSNTSHSGPQTTSTVPGFTSDIEAPAAVSGGSTLVVAGSGTVTITASVIGSGYAAGYQATATLRRNSTAIGSVDFVPSSQQTLPIVWTGEVSDGDQITLSWQTRAYFSCTMYSGTYVDVNLA